MCCVCVFALFYAHLLVRAKCRSIYQKSTSLHLGFPHKINLPMKLFVDKHNIIPDYEPINKKVRKLSLTNQRDRKTSPTNQNDTTTNQTNLQINLPPVNQNEREKLEMKTSNRKIFNEEDTATLQKGITFLLSLVHQLSIKKTFITIQPSKVVFFLEARQF